MNDLIYCQAGCTIRGVHTDGCPGDDCKGCAPRTANHGQLCAWCYRRLEDDITTIPDLVRHLRVIGAPHAQTAPPSDGRNYHDPAEGNILPAAWTAADELHAMLASWALLILEEHPNGRHMVGPDEAGAWHTRYGTTVGIAHIRATTALVRWLIPILEWCAGQSWAAEMRKEVSAAVSTAAARWPTATMTEPDRPVTMPCPRCELMSLRYSPPSVERAPFRVACTNPDCARIWTEDEWEWLVTMVTKGERMGA